MKGRILLLAAIFFGIIVIIAVQGCSYIQNVKSLYVEGETTGDTTTVNGYENDFTLKDLDAKDVSISDFSGEIIVLNFWATWCPPCRAEIPDFIEVYNDYRDKGVQFIGISNEDVATIKDFAEENGMNYPILVDRSNIGSSWDVRAIPTTFILDRSGKVLFKNVGMMTRAQLEKAIEDAL